MYECPYCGSDNVDWNEEDRFLEDYLICHDCGADFDDIEDYL